MNREANLISRRAIWVLILFLAFSVWDCETVRGEAQVSYPADGAVIVGLKYEDNIYTYLEFIPGASAVKHTGYFSGNYDDVANRIEDANLGEPLYPPMANRYYVGLPPIPPANDTLVRGTTYYWTVDETDADGQTFPGEIWEFTIQGYYAFEPIPPDEAVDVEPNVLLSWQPGYGACRREVYIGTSWADVNNAVYDPNNPPPEFLASTSEPNILVTGLDLNTKYYWRVDELSGRSCCTLFIGCTICKGEVWSFTTAGGEAQPENPADGALIDGLLFEDVIYTTLDFIPGASAVEHTGYFHYDYDKVSSRAEDANLGDPPYGFYRYYVGLYLVEPWTDSLVRGTTYYWTVDETDAEGQTYPGEIWEFTIRDFYASEPSPPNEATFVETDVLLSWQPGYGVWEHDVYMGTSWEDVNNARYDFNEPKDSNGNPYVGPDEYLTSLTEPNILVTGLAHGVKYYWRIDGVWGRLPPPSAATYYIGDVWCFTTEAQTIYVDVDAVGANNGASWENAYNFLQDALIEADTALKPVEIHVAEGIYKPDRSTSDPNGSGSRGASFVLINGVTIKGGYAGIGEPDPNARDIEAYETILSGDLDGNDVDVNDPTDLLDEPTRSENSYHVLIGSGTDANAVLDGFKIIGGNAEGANYGGGVYNNNGRPTIISCIFSENSAGRSGGGMFNNSQSHPTVTNCTFTLNAAYSGGGMQNLDFGKPMLTNCTFIRNLSYGRAGGGICGGYGRIISCTFTGNSANKYGGGLADCGGLISDCTITGNSAGISGGGFDYVQANPGVLINCIINGNTSGDEGGGIYFRPPTIPPPPLGDSTYPSYPMIVITNCTVSGNVTGGDGGGIFTSFGRSLLTNCILWGNTPDQVYGDITMVTYSVVQGGYIGLGNIDADPCFVDFGEWDLRLTSDSPCIDAGDNNAPNLPAIDIDGHPRIIDGDCNGIEVVDMGAYEFNYVYLGDFDYNCEMDFADFSIIALAWLTEPADTRWNPLCNISTPLDNIIDSRDLRLLCENWLAGK